VVEDTMNKNENIHIKLEINKDPVSEKLHLLTRFDSNAPNFLRDENGFSWSPTKEERDFLNEAFDVLLKKKTSTP
jgi:hypothetical protein